MQRLLVPLCTVIAFVLSSCGTDSGGPNPQINGLQPDSGPPGTMVTISGSGFSPEATNNTVTFGGTPAPVNSASESTIQTNVPDGLSQGSAQVVEVTVGDQTAIGPSFTVDQAAPGISSVEPDSGTVGTEVTLNGINFSTTASENTIEFSGAQAPVKSAAEDVLKTEVPQEATDGPVKVTVEGKSTIGPEFDVIKEGTLVALTLTSGSDQDSDGYTLSIDGDSVGTIEKTDAVYVPNLEEGTHKAALSDIAPNCSLEDSNPRSVKITSSDTTATYFNINCQVEARNKIAFQSDRDGDNEIYLMNTDGSNPEKITDNASFDGSPAISNDGSKIVFQSDRDGSYTDLYIMDVDGTNVQRLTSSAALTGDPNWSPNDSKIVFYDYRDGDADIYTINPDGTGLKQIADLPGAQENPNWSPVGNEIVYTNYPGDGQGGRIYIINEDGSGAKKLIEGYGPAWSPDGSRIAFTGIRDEDGIPDIFTMNPDGTGVKQVTNDTTAAGSNSTWSPDGSQIAFDRPRDGEHEIYKINVDGHDGLINLTAISSNDASPSWSPLH